LGLEKLDEDMPRVLVIYYSRTGYTRRIAEAVAAKAHATVEAIVEDRSRRGFLNYLRSGREALTGRAVPIRSTAEDPSTYDILIIGTPVWAGHVSSPVRTYLLEHRSEIRRTAFFCTQHSSGADKVFREMASLVGQTPLATLTLNDRTIKADRYGAAVDQYVARLLGPPGKVC